MKKYIIETVKRVSAFRKYMLWLIPVFFITFIIMYFAQFIEVTDSFIPASGRGMTDSLDKIEIMLYKKTPQGEISDGTLLAVPHAYLKSDVGNVGRKDGVEQVYSLTLKFFYDTLEPTGLAFEKQKLADKKIAKANKTGRELYEAYQLKTNIQVSLVHGVGRKFTKFLDHQKRDFEILKANDLLFKLDEDTWQLKADPRKPTHMYQELDLDALYNKTSTHYFPMGSRMAKIINSFACPRLCSLSYWEPETGIGARVLFNKKHIKHWRKIFEQTNKLINTLVVKQQN